MGLSSVCAYLCIYTYEVEQYQLITYGSRHMCMYNQSLASLATIDQALAGSVATPHNQSLASLVASPQLAAQSVE